MIELVRIIIISLVIISSSWVVGYIMLRAQEKAMDEKIGEIILLRPRKIFFWIGLVEIMMTYAIIIGCLCVPNEKNLAAAIGAFIMSFLGIWLIMYYLNWRIELCDEEFVFRNMFRKKTRYKYTDITHFKRTQYGFNIYIGKHKISMGDLVSGSKEFERRIQNLHFKIKK